MQRQKLTALAVVALAAALHSGCGDYITGDRAPVTLVIDRLEATSGGLNQTGGTLQSDVITIVDGANTIFSDGASATFRAIMKNPGSTANPVTPTDINAVTINRYRVVFVRSDGRNRPGVDVPQPFDSAFTLTVPVQTQATAGFELVRHNAKEESPLATLAFSDVIISTIAEITFFGHDQAGNELSVTGRIGVDFGNFADPD